MIYLDTSAFVKLVRPEEHTPALRAHLADHADRPRLSSVLLVIETRRTVQRWDQALLPRADELLSRVGRIGLTADVVETAGRLPGRTLRSLDAVHVATALLLAQSLTSFVTYDERQADAAREQRLPVVRPS